MPISLYVWPFLSGQHGGCDAPMALTISDNVMTGDRTPTPRAVQSSLWEVSWLPCQYLDRNEAITAMVLADTTASGDVNPGDRAGPTFGAGPPSSA